MISDQRSHACGHRDLTVASHPQVLSPVCRNCGRTWADPASSPEPSMHPIRKMTMNKKTQQERGIFSGCSSPMTWQTTARFDDLKVAIVV